MSPRYGYLPNMSDQLKDPGSTARGSFIFCPGVSPAEPILRLIRLRTISGRGRGALGDGANLKTNSLLVVRLFASPPRLPPCRIEGSRFIQPLNTKLDNFVISNGPFHSFLAKSKSDL